MLWRVTPSTSFFEKLQQAARCVNGPSINGITIFFINPWNLMAVTTGMGPFKYYITLFWGSIDPPRLTPISVVFNTCLIPGSEPTHPLPLRASRPYIIFERSLLNKAPAVQIFWSQYTAEICLSIHNTSYPYQQMIEKALYLINGSDFTRVKIKK